MPGPSGTTGQNRVMPADLPTAARPEPVQQFKPTTGVAIGVAGLVACVLVLVVVVLTERNADGVRVALGTLLVAALIWAVLLRPRATAYRDTLLLRGIVSDTHVPLAAIDTALVRNVLAVWTDDRRYTCAGISRSTRSMVKRPRGGGALQVLGIRQFDDRMAAVGDIGGTDYPTFVETRITELASAARRDGRPVPGVRREWAVPELAAIGGLTLAFVASLLL